MRSVVSYLEMRELPREVPAAPVEGLHLERLDHPSLPFYRFLYNTVGGPWHWVDRRHLDDTELAALIHAPGVTVQVLYGGGEPLGFSELDFRIAGEVEIVYCGLMPHCVGRGLGRYLLGQTLALAWAGCPERVWLHTCSLDHPQALDFYRRAGFVKTHERVEWVAEPMA